ncbi:MAG TPA: EAL domain-containing protein, partial [Candidatus Dormibacteraeota bacterium]|nr:EAL domain-containing protein [Candidatus Dormibacteraeota bacterium]
PLLRPEGTGIADLFAAARKLGRLRDLDWLCRRRALECATELPQHLLLFVNVTVTALLDPVHPVDQMLLLTRAAGRDPHTLVLELSEREVFIDRRRLRYVLASYREHGVQFAIDDVGDGRATLEVLAAAMPEFVKIAPGLTSSMMDAGTRAAIEATCAFARESNAQVIAEGVESKETAERLALAGLRLAQGMLFGRPAQAQTLSAAM